MRATSSVVLRAVALGALLLLGACRTAAAPAPGGGSASAPAGAAPAPAANAPAASAPAPAAQPGGAEIPIGVSLELSGPASVFGQPHQDVMRMLVERVNGQGGISGRPVKLIVYDNESNETKALVTVKRLVEEDNVVAVLGTVQTPTTMAYVPYVTEQQVPAISMGSANAIIEPPAERRWMFKTPGTTTSFVNAIIPFLQSKGWTRVGFMSVNNAYGDSGRSEFERLAAENNLQVVAWEKFGAADTDMKPVLTRLRAQNPQAIVVWAIPPAAAVIDKNYKELGITIPLVHDSGASTWPYHELAAGANEGVYILALKSMVPEQLPDSDPTKAPGLQLVRDAEAKYGKRYGGIEATGYDVLLLAINAIERAGPDRAKVRDALEATQNFVGSQGIYSMSPTDHNGLERNTIMVQIRDGKWVPVE